MNHHKDLLISGADRASKIVVLSLLMVLRVSAASFQPLGDLSGGNVMSVATGVSADGKVVCGYSCSALSGTSYEAFRWTAADGMVGLGDLPGGSFTSFATAISSDGTTVVGYSRSALGYEAFRWTEAGGMQSLGDLPGGSFGSYASGVSAHGEAVVGYSPSASSGTRFEAFRWTAETGMVGLGDLPGGDYVSRAWAVSADGSVVVGESGSSNGTEAFRWTAATGMAGLGDFSGGIFNSIAYGVSADGLAVIGRGYSGAYDPYTHEAFRWTETGGLVGLGFIPCNNWSIAHAVSGDGSVIVGDPESNTGDCAFVWDIPHGMRSLHSVLSDEYGLDLTGWQLSGARGINGDSHTIVGFGINPAGQTEGWIVSLAPPRLAIRRQAHNALLCWPTNGPGFTLQSANHLSPSDWTDCTNVPVVVGTDFTVIDGVSNPTQFYRLRK